MRGAVALPVAAALRVTVGDRELVEGRDFTLDRASGVVRFHEAFGGGLATISNVVTRPARIKGGAQWKREIRGRRP